MAQRLVVDRTDNGAGTLNIATCPTAHSRLLGLGLGPATAIATLGGEVPIEWLRTGDKVLTRDRGYVPVGWVGRIKLHYGTLVCRYVSTAPDSHAGAGGLVTGHLQPVLRHDPLLVEEYATAEVLITPSNQGPSQIRMTGAPGGFLFALALFKPGLVLADGHWVESLEADVPCTCGGRHPALATNRPRPLFTRPATVPLTGTGAA